MTWNLFIDDIRNVDYVKADGKEYVLARSMAAALELIHERGFPAHIAFDHDLGWNNLALIKGSSLVAAPKDGKEAPSGFDFAKWIVESDLNGVINIPKTFTWSIHSSNPVGKANIHGLLCRYMASKFPVVINTL